VSPDVQDAVLTWGESRLRDLPWRRTRDGWAILVSELMLQQTQVARVLPKFAPFLERFPTPAECADADVGEVVRAWAGLGYNRRAVSLHAAACVVVERHRGQVPGTLDDLLALPGVGGYTARAVLAYAFETDAAVVDTNVARVLARVAGRSLRSKEVQAAADAALPAGEAWSWNQVMMDLGATVCAARVWRCHDCPIGEVGACAWHASGQSGADPAVGSAGVSGGQSRFDGSDRQGRGRLVSALRDGPVPIGALPATMGWPDDRERATRVLATLERDRLVRVIDGVVTLP
jgi:A/G-specific adenine glycosylase